MDTTSPKAIGRGARGSASFERAVESVAIGLRFVEAPQFRQAACPLTEVWLAVFAFMKGPTDRGAFVHAFLSAVSVPVATGCGYLRTKESQVGRA